MDLYSILSLEVFLLVPFVIYFLFLKKNGGRSLYSGRDIFYPIKYNLAKNVVKAAQKKSKKHRKKLIERDIEPEVIFSVEERSYYQGFSGCDQKGNSLMLRFSLRSTKTAEVILVLKLANGSIYSFPGTQKVHITSLKENKWKINGLNIESLEPYRSARIVYNGLLQNVSCKSYEKIEHVQFNFIKNNHPEGYEQFGTLLGFVKVDAYPAEQELNLPACRSRYGGPDERFLMDREIKVFLAETNGVLISLTLQSLKEEQSQLNYGYICHQNHITVPITGQDIRLINLGKNKILPELFMARISTKTEQYTCVFNLNKASASLLKSETGVEVYIAFAECDVNISQGKAVLDFQYYEPHDLKLPKLKPILCEKKTEVLPNDYVVGIKSNEAKILDLTGGKGNSLALLTSLGSDEFLVPDGLIVTVNAFKRQLTESKLLQEAVHNIDDAFCGRSDVKRENVCEVAVRLFTNESVQSEVAKDIIKMLNKVKMDSANDAIDVVSWAVRSSAIGEDSEELSAAGQNETILGCVTENEILRAVSKCWASLFTYQSVQYRWQHGIPIKADMAVVIQKMVPAEAAGVLFTWHPTTSNPSQMVITSNFGLGESVVSGKSDPDTFILNRTYDGKICLLDQVIGTKDKVLTLTEKGVKEICISEEQEGSFVFVNEKDATENWSLTKEQVLELGRIGLLLEEAFGGPRDIEWAFYKGDLYLLQSRPITTLNAWTDFELAHELDTAIVTENSMFTLANSGEVFPMPVSALSRTSILCSLDRGMQSYIHNRIDFYFLKTLCAFQHRVMIDCILALYFNERTEELQMATKVLDLAVFGHPVINEKINRTVRTRLGPMPRFNTLRETYRRWRDSQMILETVQKTKEFVKKSSYGITDDDTIENMYNKIVSNDDATFIPCYYHAFATSASVFWQMICMMVLIGKEKELNTEHYADFANILSSCEDVESAEVPVYLEKISKIIRAEGYSEEFCTIKPELGVDWLKTKCPAANKVFEDFLNRHGHRGLGEFDLKEETWGLNPSQVIPMVQANVKHMREVVKEHKTIDQVINDLVSPVNAVTKWILKYTLSKLRVAVGKREQSKSLLIMAIHKCRLAYKKLAARMVREGLMPSESLIYHLTVHELGQVIKTRNCVLISKAMKRQRLYLKWNNLKFPEISYGLPQPENDFETPVELLPGSKCNGTPVCTGSVQARACVITHLDEIGSLETGDILITYCTDIGWTPYFPMLSGVVTELGGLVSHGAVVAREYGLPCIVGVKNVTKMFKTGDIVHLSGKTGELGKI